MADRPSFADMAEGLLTLEINTVEKDGMTALKMPTPANALIDIVQTYWDFLCRKSADFGIAGVPLAPWARILSRSFDWAREPFVQSKSSKRTIADPTERPQPGAYRPDFTSTGPDKVTLDYLDDLREVAAWIAEMQLRTTAVVERGRTEYALVKGKLTSKQLQDAAGAARRFQVTDRSILQRIKRNCDQFKNLDALKPATPESPRVLDRQSGQEAFTPSDLVAIRKAWDIGVEVILMQTVIQIDGDVVNRFQTGIDTQAKAQLHAMHTAAVDLSFRYWRWMIDALGRFAGAAVSTLFGSR